jgi:DNA processing protein
MRLLGRQLNDVEQRFAPAELYTQGEVALLSPWRVRVSVVGSRAASAEGLARSRKLSRFLAERSIIVVSGLARGIDTAAHLAAMEAGGQTIGVLGTGLDGAYPPENRDLQARIGRDHLLVTQFASGIPVQRRNFPLRNRTMALISDATVIVEAGESSGSLSQGWEALRLARPLFLLESVVRSNLEGPRQLLDYGAHVLKAPEDLLEWIPPVDTEPVALAF